MFVSMCRRLWNGTPAPARGNCRQSGENRSRRPRLEPLEDRALLASLGGGALAVALAPTSAVSAAPQAGTKSPEGATPIRVSVNENSSTTLINLGAAFGAVSGLQHEDGLKLSILGNSNSALVKPGLSEAALTLTYASGKCGTATITVCATDADGVSVKQTILVTVRPLIAAAPAPASSAPPRPTVALAPVPPR
jgi:hypothetical protein